MKTQTLVIVVVLVVGALIAVALIMSHQQKQTESPLAQLVGAALPAILAA